MRDISSGRRGGLRSGTNRAKGRTYEQLYNEAKHLGIEFVEVTPDRVVARLKVHERLMTVTGTVTSTPGTYYLYLGRAGSGVNESPRFLAASYYTSAGVQNGTTGSTTNSTNFGFGDTAVLTSGTGSANFVTGSKADAIIVVPATAILYAPYGDSVFVLSGDEPPLTAEQRFVRIGERRGDFVIVTKGLEPKEKVVSSGAFKLRNGMKVLVDNTLAPRAELEPRPENR